MQTGSDHSMNDPGELNDKHKKRRRASSSRARYAPRASIYDVVAGRVTRAGFLPEYRYAHHSLDIFSTATAGGSDQDDDVEQGSTSKRRRRHSHSFSRNRFGPSTPYRDLPNKTRRPLTPYQWLFKDFHAPTDDPARSLWGAADWLSDDGGFDKWARSRGTLPSGSEYSKPTETFSGSDEKGDEEEMELNDETAALTLKEGRSQVEVHSDSDTEEGEDSSFEGESSLDDAETLFNKPAAERISQRVETWSIPPHEELTGSPLDPPRAAKLPSSDLLKAVHAYAADAYTALYRPLDPPCHGCMDETALLAFGILMEEMVAAEVDGREVEFVEGGGTKGEDKGEAEPVIESEVLPSDGTRSRSFSTHTDGDSESGEATERSNVVVVVPPVSRQSSEAASPSSSES